MDIQGNFFLSPEQTQLEQWREAGEELMRLTRDGKFRDDQRQWRLGDWLLAGEKNFKETKFRRAAREITGFPWGTLKNLIWIARAFPPSRRRDGVSWSHHREVANLPEVQQDKLLNACLWRRDGQTHVKPIKDFRSEVRNEARNLIDTAARDAFGKGKAPIRSKAYRLSVEFNTFDSIGFRYLFETEKEVHGQETVDGMIRWLVGLGLENLGWTEKGRQAMKRPEETEVVLR